ncbi:MAG: hypothetical protein IKP73_06845 [Bacteroidales bacterium]|nr:hypothetical protein [Bacteroidales bacterium]MBR4325227.1 hypothetical protein [Bacteroidales bacterium]
MERFKYQKEIDGLIASGLKLPSLHQPNGIIGFRYVFSEDNPKNHKPVSVLNPSRELPDELKFSGYALSCYDDETAAISRYRNLCKINKKMRRTLGDALCFGGLQNTDGLMSSVNIETRHFDFYEFENCNLSQTFKIKMLL